MLYMLFLIRKSLSPCIPGDSDGKESAYMEKEMATHSSILDWRISWTGEPGRLQSMGLQESDMT